MRVVRQAHRRQAHKVKVIPLRPYLPSTGTEGAAFFEHWCSHCARDAAMREGKDLDDCDDHEKCSIIADSFMGPVAEWVYGADGYPTCTAFVEWREGMDQRETWQRELDRLEGK